MLTAKAVDYGSLDHPNYINLGLETNKGGAGATFDPSFVLLGSESTSAPPLITISIVYDFYYRTPRVYLSSKSMSPTDILKFFVVEEQGGSTATVELHPHSSDIGECVSLHPCLHARTLASLGADDPAHYPRHTYLSLFIKVVENSFPSLSIGCI